MDEWMDGWMDGMNLIEAHDLISVVVVCKRVKIKF